MNGLIENPELTNDAGLLSWLQQFAPYGIVTLDKGLCVRSWNAWMETHSGLRFDQVAAKNILTLFPDLEERKLIAPFARALSGESSVLSTALHRYLFPFPPPMREPGINHMLQTARIAPLYSGKEISGILVVIEDVTQREAQAQALQRQHKRDEVVSWALAHFLKTNQPKNSIRELFFKIAEHLDFDTFLLYVRDPDTNELNLYSYGGITDQWLPKLAHVPLLAAAAEATEAVIFTSVQTRAEEDYAVLKGARISAAVALPLSVNKRSLGVLCFATWIRAYIAKDESELLQTISQYLATAIDREFTANQLQKARKLLADHAALLEEQVRDRTIRLQETISALETFSYTLAHDLKAPVRGMIGYCDILQHEFAHLLPAEGKEVVDRLAQTPRRMERLLIDLLQFNEVSRREVQLSPLQIGPILEDLISMRQPALGEVITIRTPLHKVQGHQALLKQALSNLVDNAVKFVGPQAQPKITIYTEEVTSNTPNTRTRPLLFNSVDSSGGPFIDPKPSARNIRIWVEDEGIGIAREAHQKIFGIFERNVSDATYEGTGMGLAIVMRAMERMQGTCGVESELGVGSRFWLELPAV